MVIPGATKGIFREALSYLRPGSIEDTTVEDGLALHIALSLHT
jgi:hypothetical protein